MLCKTASSWPAPGDAGRGCSADGRPPGGHGQPLSGGLPALHISCRWGLTLSPTHEAVLGPPACTNQACNVHHIDRHESSTDLQPGGDIAGAAVPSIAWSQLRAVHCAGTHKGPDGVRLATRSMLLLAAYCQETGAHAEANYALMRAHFQAGHAGAASPPAQRCALCNTALLLISISRKAAWTCNILAVTPGRPACDNGTSPVCSASMVCVQP